MRIRTSSAILLVAVFLAPCWGCGSAGGSASELIPVKGRVTYKGQPLTKGLVQFAPRNTGREASGQIQADGTFVLTTFKEGDGVVAGKHRVSISELDKSLARDRALRKYASPNTSGLTAEVSREQTEFPFDLK
jgi:hypothetical protein